MSGPMDVAAAIDWFDHLVGRIEAATQEAMTLLLEDLAARMEPRTPRTRYVKTHMQDVYSHLVAGRTGYLFNDQFYANWVIHGTSRARNNPGLEEVLAGAEAQLEDLMNALLAQLVVG